MSCVISITIVQILVSLPAACSNLAVRRLGVAFVATPNPVLPSTLAARDHAQQVYREHTTVDNHAHEGQANEPHYRRHRLVAVVQHRVYVLLPVNSLAAQRPIDDRERYVDHGEDLDVDEMRQPDRDSCD